MVSAEALVGITEGEATRNPAASSAEVVRVRIFESSFIVENFLLGKSPAHAKTFTKTYQSSLRKVKRTGTVP